MLQITTGKLFSGATGRENHLRGVLFTNLHIAGWPEQVIEGPLFGRLTQTSELANYPKTLLYEFTERMEAYQSEPGVIISHGADPYIQEIATIVSFALNCTCSPDVDLVRRLTSGQKGIATMQAPSKYVRRIFDKEVFSQKGESDEFILFINQLLGLERKTYLGVMRAIRTFVTGLHRIADDLELAYTLMVAAGESLAQDFDGHTSSWESVAEQKRDAIDSALLEAPEDLAQRVREAVLSYEHTALARRFQAFVADNVAPEFFLAKTEMTACPVGRSDLTEVLAVAYQMRSQYVHQLRQLPDMITHGHGHSETIIDGRRRMLTLQGLARLMRHVIMTFVKRQSTVDREVYNYTRELAGVVLMPLAPNCWIANADGDISEKGRDKLEGFLEEFASLLMKQSATITDISEVLKWFVAQAPNLKASHRRPYLTLLVMFNAVAGEKAIPRSASVEALIQKELAAPCPETLVALAYFDEVPEWTIEDHGHAIREYKRRRGSKSGIRFPRLFEAAITLQWAERYRSAGQFERCKEAIANAADDYPEHDELRRLVLDIAEDKPINWKDALLPKEVG